MSEPKATESSGFLDGQYYTAAFLYEFVALLVGNGVYANELAPTANTEDMAVTHGAGHAWINGVLYKNSTPFVLPIETADGSLNRYDSLMIRLDLSSNTAYAVIVKGEFATNPTPPQPTRDAETWELKICNIYIPAGCTKITQAQIEDTRLDTAVCGVPIFPVQHLDLTTFYQQITADLAEFKANYQADFTSWETAEKGQALARLQQLVQDVQDTSESSTGTILALLAQLNDLVDADTVGKLIAQINSAHEKADKLEKTRARLFSAEFTSAGWAAQEAGGYAQTVACEGVTAQTQTARPFILPILDNQDQEEAQAEALGYIAGGNTKDGEIELICPEEAPAVDLTIYFLGVEVNENS